MTDVADELPLPMKTVELTPNWEATTLWFAEAFKWQSFDKGASEPIITFIEQIRYLGVDQPRGTESCACQTQGIAKSVIGRWDPLPQSRGTSCGES